jgi:Na+-transporting methylmalonyl-CoA/oxaloacetate decarboxylase gamma subunit
MLFQGGYMAKSNGSGNRQSRKWSLANKLTVAGIVVTIFLGILATASTWMTPEFRRFFGLESPTATTSKQQTQSGNASSSGANSPAVTGDGNTITYDQSQAATQTKHSR